jgi:hypothetical protein
MCPTIIILQTIISDILSPRALSVNNNLGFFAIQTLQEYGANREAVGEFLPMQWADIGYGVKEMSGGEVP